MTLLRVSAGYGLGYEAFYIDGRKVKRDAWNAAFDAANCDGKLSCAHTKQRKGQFYHYWSA